MIFNSATFLIFFIVFFLIYWFINNKLNIRFRNVFIILASYFFYGYWDWRFLGLIILSSIIDFTIGILLNKETKESRRKALLITSVVINLGILGFFKYFDFFIDSLNQLLNLFSIKISPTTLKIILPVGISFYTFQTLSYTIDVFKRKILPTKDVLSFFAFVSFFPQLVAGPIERASHLLGQFNEKKFFKYSMCMAGLRLVIWGFFKKIVIADNLGVLSDSIFNAELTMNGVTVIIGSIFFALQIYADFSGYSDIAIGISRMLGFNLKANFKTPYFSNSFSSFWNRWHISLSTWFRDYVYIPLGGNQKTSLRVNINILATFLLSGFWHGANITFLIWGALHGIALVIEKRIKIKLNTYVYAPFVIGLVVLFYIPFRANDLSHLQNLISSLIHFSTYSFSNIIEIISEFSNIRFITITIITVLFLMLEHKLKLMDFNEWIIQKKKPIRISIYYSLLLIILMVGNFSVKPNFIYFQF